MPSFCRTPCLAPHPKFAVGEFRPLPASAGRGLKQQKPLARKIEIQPRLEADLGCLSSLFKKNISVLSRPKSPAFSAYPVPARGACRPSRNVGRGERWARRVTRRVTWRARRSRVVLTPGLLASSSWEANASRGRWCQEAPIHQGERDISRKAIAQGRPECFR
jgi:hypothetical protein